jgi:hypothetical protein
MKNDEVWARWEESKRRIEHDCTCIDPDEEISTMGSTPNEITGQKSSAKRRRLPGKTITSRIKKGQPKDDNPPSVACDRPKRATQRQGQKLSTTNITDDESSCSSPSQSKYSDQGSDHSIINYGLNENLMFLFT